jgi:type I restriction enzyme R subunit
MPTPGEHKTVQARILAYAEAIGWTFVSREEAEQRRGFDPEVPPADRAKNRSLFLDDLLDAKLREFSPRYAEAEGALLGQFRHLHTDIYGNREFVEHLRNRGKFFNSGINRRHPQPNHTHEAFWKTSHEQHLDRS